MASPVNQQLKRNCFESLDKISSLPEEVITKILEHLPIRDAVGTSRLSRVWRFRWMSIRKLVFDTRSTFQGQTSNQWINFINNVFLIHGGDVTKVEIKNLLESDCPYVDRWLVLLWRKKLSHLCIGFQKSVPYRCPSTLFHCQDLTTLELQGCGLQLPPQIQFYGFKNLIVLRLYCANLNKETIEFLVNNSPHLQDLNLCQSETISHLCISAPNLRTCRMWVRCESITFKTLKLRFIFINKWLQFGVAGRCKLDGILGGLVQVQDCRIYHPFIEFLSVNNFWKSLPIIYCHLKHVGLRMDFEDPKQILAALWLFRSSPLLKTISIHVVRINHVLNEDLCMEEFYEAVDKREALLKSLEIAKFLDFQGSNKELRFIQFLLLNANVLRTMQIKWKGDKPVGLRREGDALFELLMLQRTSPRMKFDLPGWEHNKKL